ncbi:hypothetical protein [Microcoleus sp. M2_C4]|uniref:hypothetical protein n=3 Tax=Microcoleus TaxID=44471 RepID=UPI002FD24067
MLKLKLAVKNVDYMKIFTKTVLVNLGSIDANVVAYIKLIGFERSSWAAPEYQSRFFLPIAQLGTIIEVYNLEANYYCFSRSINITRVR